MFSLCSAVSEEDSVFFEMSSPNGLNITMEIKCCLLTHVKYLTSLSSMMGEWAGQSSFTQFSKAWEQRWLILFQTKVISGKQEPEVEGEPQLIHFFLCSQSPPKGILTKVMMAPHNSHHLSHKNWLLALFHCCKPLFAISFPYFML